MALGVAGFIDGSCVHGETLRRALYASTGGATGVTRGNDLAVIPQTVPGAGVYVTAGGGVIATRYTDADPGQSYSVSNGAPELLTVPPNDTTAAVTWHVIIRVYDPQFAGEPIPESPTDDPYCLFELVHTLPETKPYLLLATITMPPNTGVVQQENISDKRELLQPKSARVLKAFDIPSDSRNYVLTWSKYQSFPAAASFYVKIPEWATEVRAKIEWQSLIAPKGYNVSSFAIRFGGGPGEPDRVWLNPTTLVVGDPAQKVSSAGPLRMNIGTSGTWRIPASWRGTTVTVCGDAMKNMGDVNLSVDKWSSASVDLQFVESPASE